MLLLLFLLAATGDGSWSGYHWWKTRPKPKLATVTAAPIPVTPIVADSEKVVPSSLQLNFSEPAAPIDLLGKEVKKGITISPHFDGTWRWDNDRTLVFRPSRDWPAATTYRVRIDPKSISSHVRLEKLDVEVTSPAFTANIAEFTFYQDPARPEIKQGVAKVEFSHPVTQADLEKNCRVAMLSGFDAFTDKQTPLTYSVQRHGRVAHIRTAPLKLPEQDDFLKLTISEALRPEEPVAKLGADVESKLKIPGSANFFKVDSISGRVFENQQGKPEQLLVVETSAEARSEDIAKSLTVYLLPKDKPAAGNDAAVPGYTWKSPSEITLEILALAKPIAAEVVPSEQPNSKLHSLRIKQESDGYIYVKLAKGAKAVGDYLLKEDYENVFAVPQPEKIVAIEGDGGILALSGERKLSVRSRGVDAIEYEIARVPADQINHLVSQTEGQFQNPQFINSHFNEQNLARIAREQQDLLVRSQFDTNYSSFDLGKHLTPSTDGGSALQGLFFVKARELKEPGTATRSREDSEDEQENDDSDRDRRGVSDRRFILVTDLGLVVKQNADASHDVFVASINGGKPFPGVQVTILAKNSVPLVSGTTDADGRVAFPPLAGVRNEREPVAFVARYQNDVSFLPYERDDRRVEYSRFDIGGVETKSGADLDAFLFTERGVYRPGDLVHIGFLAKRRDWANVIAGLPVEAEVLDASGQSVQTQKLAVPPGGFFEISLQTRYESPSGYYHANLYLVKEDKRDAFLGSTEFLVKEFLPDRMKLDVQLSGSVPSGWMEPEGHELRLNLQNLYGTPASGRRITARIQVLPGGFSFDEYSDFTFFDPENKGRYQRWEPQDLGETSTDEQGDAHFDLDLQRFAGAAFRVTVFAEAFEQGSGRSVTRQVSALVSKLPYVIGYRTAANLAYLPMKRPASLELIAINAALQKVPAAGLKAELIEKRFASVLTRQENGSLAYTSVEREVPVSTTPLEIAAVGGKFTLPTDRPGKFCFRVIDGSGTKVAQASFQVAGEAEASHSLEKDTELDLKVSKDSYAAGDEVELQISAPYTGAGLITIERDRVYAQKWFTLNRTSDVQRIRIPEGFEGTGYINVCLVRALDSREVFTNPLSVGVAPFKANLEARRLGLTLNVAKKVRPGERLPIEFSTNKPSKIALFAVDQGILQVTNFQTPDPLNYFFRKAALMVQTTQILDLILPEYSVLRSASAFGGGEEPVRNLNPFKRVTEKPVVYWSGIVDADPEVREVAYDVPDYFSGSLRVMAVALSPEATGSAQADVLVRGPFVLTPSVPVFVAPGDAFDVSVMVANDVEGSGVDAPVQISITPSEHLEITGSAQQTIQVSQGTERPATFHVKAREALGSASLTFEATYGKEKSRIRSTMSVRPPVPYRIRTRAGVLDKKTYDLPLQRELRPEYRQVEARLSSTPMGLAHGLLDYLKQYPYGCSEQISSGAFCRLMLFQFSEFDLSREKVAEQMEHTFDIERTRQGDNGSFGYWGPGGPDGIDFISVYVTHLLIEAKTQGFPPPVAMMTRAVRHLNEIAAMTPDNLTEARTVAYAIYLLTREGEVTTNYVLNLKDTLSKSTWSWRDDLTAVYMGGALAMMKKTEEGADLAGGYRLRADRQAERFGFYSRLAMDSQYVTVIARHFPELLAKIGTAELDTILQPIQSGDYHSLSAAYAVQALRAFSTQDGRLKMKLSIAQKLVAGVDPGSKVEGTIFQRLPLSPDATGVQFGQPDWRKGIGAYYQVTEAGFDRSVAPQPVREGLEVSRELVPLNGNSLNSIDVGEPVTVRLRVRTVNGQTIPNVALVDLLPGGFEIARDTLTPGPGGNGCDFVEPREDRNIFFLTASPSVREITYQIKPCNRGTFTIPPAFAEAMYDRATHACSQGGTVTVGSGK